MHALKSPLMGLKNLELDAGDRMEATEENLRATTRKIENLIAQTLNTLRECDLNEESYSFEAQEVLNLVANKFNEEESGLRVSVLESAAVDQKIDNLKANLILPILHNLIQNSIDSGPDVKVFLLAELKNESLTLSVRDNGPGIPEGLKDSLFKPIQSQKENGSGIGLAICKELADRADATVMLDKSTDKGTSFTVEIPIDKTHN
jgi:K+-sensing histidine kinase KdpD